MSTLPPAETCRPSGVSRAETLDALRGVAMLWMALFHACFDLNHFGFWQPRQHFLSDPFWFLQRTAIVTLFVFCAGMGQALAFQAGQTSSRFWRRWMEIAACAVLVSVGSAGLFPRTWISFGVLHGMAVMLLLTRVLLGVATRWGSTSSAGFQGGLLLLGGVALLAPRWWSLALFNGPWGRWTGLVTRLPVTEDYVPVLPWWGLMLWGLSAGFWLQGRHPAWLSAPLRGPGRLLARLGRWSLSFYMVHQPVLVAVIGGAAWWRSLH